ncbi:MAG: glycine cleavage system aminomethyltransferase GcvT [Planctomycetota bacterium]|nr:MAG: glycine cleavage system aminomethyltransferase GcvT [Planctomycetota bacterium]
MLQTALHSWHAARGAKLVDFAGWHMPVLYTSLVEEHQAVRQRVGLFDVSHMGRLRFTGSDAENFLQELLTTDCAQLAVGDVKYSLVCQESGGILDDVLLYRREQEWALVVNASNREKLLEWFETHRRGRDIGLIDETTTTGMIAVQGPQSVALMTALGASSVASLKYYTFTEVVVGNIPCVVSRTGYTGEDGFELTCPATQATWLWEQLMAAGAALGIAPCGLGARDTLRLEAAMPLYGHEMDETMDPFTAGLAFGVRLKKTMPFIGRAALEAVKAVPTTRRRVGLKLSGKRIPREKMTILSNGVSVGYVSSGTQSPTLGYPLAMGYVPAELASPGTIVQIEIRGSAEPAEVCPLPFYRRPS